MRKTLKNLPGSIHRPHVSTHVSSQRPARQNTQLLKAIFHSGKMHVGEHDAEVGPNDRVESDTGLAESPVERNK